MTVRGASQRPHHSHGLVDCRGPTYPGGASRKSPYSPLSSLDIILCSFDLSIRPSANPTLWIKVASALSLRIREYDHMKIKNNRRSQNHLRREQNQRASEWTETGQSAHGRRFVPGAGGRRGTPAPPRPHFVDGIPRQWMPGSVQCVSHIN